MKKILLATSILAGSAGVAMADVSFSGNAYMGLSNNFDETQLDGERDFQFVTRVRFAVSMSGETDSGLSFGAGFDSQNAGNAGSTGNSETQGSATAYISGSFGKITFGDVGSASDGLIGNVAGVGMELDGNKYNELGFANHDKTAVRYEGTFDSFTVMVGIGQIDSDDDGFDDQDYSVAVKYGINDNFTVYAGYEWGALDGDEDGDLVTEQIQGSQIYLGADATFGNLTVKARVAERDREEGGVAIDEETAYALSVTGKFDAISATAYAAHHANGDDAFGIGGSYDLGGGASFVAGAAQRANADPVVDMGLKFTF